MNIDIFKNLCFVHLLLFTNEGLATGLLYFCTGYFSSKGDLLCNAVESECQTMHIACTLLAEWLYSQVWFAVSNCHRWCWSKRSAQTSVSTSLCATEEEGWRLHIHVQRIWGIAKIELVLTVSWWYFLVLGVYTWAYLVAYSDAFESRSSADLCASFMKVIYVTYTFWQGEKFL